MPHKLYDCCDLNHCQCGKYEHRNKRTIVDDVQKEFDAEKNIVKFVNTPVIKERHRLRILRKIEQLQLELKGFEKYNANITTILQDNLDFFIKHSK